MDDETLLAQLEAVSSLAALGHDRDRLQALAPKVADLFETIRRVRAVDVEGYEMAVNYQNWLPAR